MAHGDNDGKLLSIQRHSELEVPEYWQRISKLTVCVVLVSTTELRNAFPYAL
jgi:hypothetical protein